MKLMTKELEKKFEKYPLYSQNGMGGNAKVIVKFFNPVGVGTWLITEGNKLENGDYEMFGYCHLGDNLNAELGYVMLSDLENIKLPFGLKIERDLYLRDNITLSEAIKENGFEVESNLNENIIFASEEFDINDLINSHQVPIVIDEFIDSDDDLTDEKIMNGKLPDSHNKLVYCDNDICYYDCGDGDYIYTNTREAIGLMEEFSNSEGVVRVNELAFNNLFIDYEGRNFIKEIAKKYKNRDSINSNSYISDDFKVKLDEAYESDNSLNYLINCEDYLTLKENLNLNELKRIDNVLQDFSKYQKKYDDGSKDIIGEYTSKYGNSYIIDWYEGLMDTKEFIEDYKHQERSDEYEK